MELSYYEQISRIKNSILNANSTASKKISALLMIKEISFVLKKVDNLINSFDGKPEYYQPLMRKVNEITKELFKDIFDVVDKDNIKSNNAYNKVRISVAMLSGIVSEYQTLKRLK